jgi:hypothetical protein
MPIHVAPPSPDPPWRDPTSGKKPLWPVSAASGQDADEPFRYLIDPVLRVGIVVAAVGVTIQTVIHLVNAALGGGSFFDANGEHNPIAWSHSVAIFAGAFVCAVHAAALRERRRTFIALVAIFAFFSLDEMLVLHERLALRVLDVFGLPVVWDSVIWPVLYLPLTGTLLVLLLSVALAAPPRAGRLVFLGLGFLVAAVIAEVLSAPASTSVNWVHTLEGAFEEGAELAGWILIATGLTAMTLLGVRGASPWTDDGLYAAPDVSDPA